MSRAARPEVKREFTGRLVARGGSMCGVWVLIPTNAVWREPFWTFRHGRHLAVAFAARRGIRLTEEGR